ncbi:MAG: N-acetylmuramoyl-L-alanine amidase [Victivallales bacterium]|jgi:N-acetylmuramoyl-L-alanine amidase
MWKILKSGCAAASASGGGSFIVCFFIFLSLVFAAEEAEAGPYIRYTTVHGMRYVYLKDVAKYYGMDLQPGDKFCDMRNRSSNATFVFNKREGKINGITVNYMFPPYVAGVEPMISEFDFNLLLDPVIRSAVPRCRVGIIVLDPGHGGKDNGAQGRLYNEKDLNLQIARRLKDVLRAKGYIVLLTRDKDVFFELGDRSGKASAMKADLFVSIHSNSAGRGVSAINGIETFCLTPEAAPSTADAKAKNVSKERGNAYNKNNYLLAYNVHRSILRNTGATDRGVKHARFAVLKDAPCPAILVETGFMSNLYEERKLGTGAYQDKLAFGIADGIIAYHRAMSGK